MSQTTTPASEPAASPAAVTAFARPDWAPENLWDGEKANFKPEANDFFKGLLVRDAEYTAKQAAIPADPSAYEVALPKDFAAPEGVEFEIDANDPDIGKLREFAHKSGLGQEQFSAILALHAGRETARVQALNEAKAANMQQLGAAVEARIGAVSQWLDAKGYGALKGTLWTADIVKSYEQLMRDTSSQGAHTPPANGRDGPANGGIPDYDKMSFEQRRAAQDQLPRRAAAR